MVTQTRKMTASEFLSLPVSNQFHELIHGEEIMSPSPSEKHQIVSGNTYIVMRGVIPNGRVLYAPIDVYLDEENVVQPDILWIAEGGACRRVNDKYLQGAPDLVVEIFSPGTVRRDKKEKFYLYEKFGVREYWMIDPDEKLLEIWQLVDGRFRRVDVFAPEDTCKSPLLGDVSIKAIFADS